LFKLPQNEEYHISFSSLQLGDVYLYSYQKTNLDSNFQEGYPKLLGETFTLYQLLLIFKEPLQEPNINLIL